MARCSGVCPDAPSAFITSASVFHSFVFSSSLKSWSTVVGLVPSNKTRTLSFFFILGHSEPKVAHASRVLVSASRRNDLFLTCRCRKRGLRFRRKVRERQRPSPARGTHALPNPLHAGGVITSAAHLQLNIDGGFVI